MREDFTAVVDTLPGVPENERAALADGAATKSVHDDALNRLAALNVIEHVPPTLGRGLGATLRVAAWNAERLKFHQASRALLEAVNADVVLLTEVDIGMARSGNVHTVRAASPEGFGWAFATEYVELGLGDEREQTWHRGETNTHGLHGNAIMSRLPLSRPRVVALDEGGAWFTADMKEGQRRIGGRMALLAQAAGVWFASVHLESESDASLREAQIRTLLAGLGRASGDGPAVIGGDLNTKALAPGEPVDFDGLAATEPLFAALGGAGFGWRPVNTPEATQRTRPDGTPPAPFVRLDWLAVRGLRASEPRTVFATDPVGLALSDHELVAATLDLSGVRPA